MKPIKPVVKEEKPQVEKADKDINVGLLISVIDEVRLSGIKNFSIVTERR